MVAGSMMTRNGPPLIILGLESSCDDTAAAIVQVGADGPKTLAQVIESQTQLHHNFGGVVPEIAARAHTEKLDGCVAKVLEQTGKNLSDVDAIAVTAGPGLIGGVLAGVMFAKGLSAGSGKPLIGVNHLAGHALTPRLSDGIAYPYLMLLVSGGHCQFLEIKSPADYKRLGGTIDDAPGEAFDKTARLLGLAQPGGPSVEAEAKKGNAKVFKLPRPLLDRDGCDMSFSGLKTALLRARDAIVTEHGGLPKVYRSDLCAAFQQAVTDVLVEKTRRAIGLCPDATAVAVAGGVAANMTIRQGLVELCDTHNLPFVAPPLSLCTDNAAMIAYAGAELFALGRHDDLTLSARPRWPLDQTASPMLGSGKKGAKA